MAQRSARVVAPELVPGGTTEDGDGILLGAGPAVDVYIDFLCPFCRRFEEASGAELEAIVDRGLGSVVYHPLGFLDRLSTTRYSSRAAAASGCAALFANQPEEGGPGLSDYQLAQLGVALGLDPGFARCIGDGRYLDWSVFVTARAVEHGVTGTPSVFVDGISVPANGQMISAALEEISR
ncbi:MAG: disulfide bond formation protein DsbA [Actinobacteria bacterium]|nr:MAG: disulfide bond formation protein DsbA [Actinomycetota bacterium]